MAIAGTDLKFFRAYTKAEGSGGAEAAVSLLTGNWGGKIRGALGEELSSTAGSIVRNVSGTDLSSLGASTWQDYKKIYARNWNQSLPAPLELTTVGTMITPHPGGAYVGDTFSMGIGLTHWGFHLNDGADTDSVLSIGQEDYDEDTSASTPEDSPYIRIDGTSVNINSVDDYSFDYSAIKIKAAVLGTANIACIVPAGVDLYDHISNAFGLYIKVVGQNGNNIVVGYIDLTVGDKETPVAAGTTCIAMVDRYNVAPTRQEFTRVLYASVHRWTKYAGGVSSLVADSGGREGDLYYVRWAAGEGTVDLPFYVDENAGVAWVTACGKMLGKETGVGQSFATCFFPETEIGSTSTALRLPSLDANATPAVLGVDFNEYMEVQNKYCALWVRREIAYPGADSQPGITNRISLFGDSL